MAVEAEVVVGVVVRLELEVKVEVEVRRRAAVTAETEEKASGRERERDKTASARVRESSRIVLAHVGGTCSVLAPFIRSDLPLFTRREGTMQHYLLPTYVLLKQ